MREPGSLLASTRPTQAARRFLWVLASLVWVASHGCGADDSDGAGFTFEGTVQPVLLAHCGECHAGQSQGGTDFAGVYAEALAPSVHCAPDPVFRCILQRVLDGSMPLGKGCTGDPVLDANNSACLSTAEQQLLKVWVLDGAPE